MTVLLNLTVNDIPIMTDYFVASFVDHTFCGMIESLEGTSPVHDLNLTIENGKVTINLNGSDVPVNEFVTKIFITTTNGILQPLKGVTQPVKKVKLLIKK